MHLEELLRIFENVSENIDQRYCCSDYYDVSVNKYSVEHHLRFWENKGRINPIDPFILFQWYFRYWLGRRSKDDERQKKKEMEWNCK